MLILQKGKTFYIYNTKLYSITMKSSNKKTNLNMAGIFNQIQYGVVRGWGSEKTGLYVDFRLAFREGFIQTAANAFLLLLYKKQLQCFPFFKEIFT